MGKGFHGESVPEVIRSIMKPGRVLSFSELVHEIKKKGPWRDETIWQTLMALVMNLVPARHHWQSSSQFLFLRADGRYELYNPTIHPKIIE
jgi:hypothetical protein